MTTEGERPPPRWTVGRPVRPLVADGIYARGLGMPRTMGPSSDRWEVELAAVREELQRMHAEQKQMATAIQELVTTFRTLATHLGIASEPYVRKGEAPRERDIPGFG